MQSKLRLITVDGDKFFWSVKSTEDGQKITIWKKDNKVYIHEEYVLVDEVTPKLISLIIKNIIEPPRYTHDCHTCRYMGRHEEYDLYYCGNEPTVIARYSNIGSDYTSGMIFARPNGVEPLYQAKLRAIQYGIIKE